MLSNEQITNNKNEFIELVSRIDREGSDIDLLIRQLEHSDFFTAPASTKHHGSYEGGLCEHCLNVFHNMEKLNDVLGFGFPETPLIIVSLLHDFSKMNLYVKQPKNVKRYCNPEETRSNLKDELGFYRWESVMEYRIRDPESKFIFGSHEQTSDFMANTFIPLTVEEHVAILNHHGGLCYDSSKDPNIVSQVYSNYPLAMILHFADCIDAYGHSQNY